MRRNRLPVASVLVLVAVPAFAGPKFQRPPANSGPAKSMDRDTSHLPGQLERCSKDNTALGESLRSWAQKAAALADPADRQAFGQYFAAMQKEYDQQQLGIPGEGTYAELRARRDKEMSELEALWPKNDAPKTAAEMTATRDALAKYKEKARALHELGIKLDALSPCLRQAGDWHAIVHGLQPSFVQERITKFASPIMNTLRSGFSTWSNDGEKLVEQGKTRPSDADAMAKLVHSAANLAQSMSKETESVGQLAGWADYAPRGDKDWYASAPARLAALVQGLTATVDKYLPEVKAPAGKKDGSAEKTFKAWFAGFHKGASLKTVRISDTGTRDREEYDKKTGVKYRLQYKYVKAYYVTSAIDEPAVTSVPKAELCELRWATLVYYQKGLGVPLRKWVYDAPPMKMSPMLCKNASATF